MSHFSWIAEAKKGPICALAPMDGYTDSAYRQIVKHIAPTTIVFSEFYSADGLVHSKELQKKALTHDPSEMPLIIQIFGKDPQMFGEAAKIIESSGIAGIDINMGCPAKKVVKSGHGSSLMIARDTAFEIVRAMHKAVKIPISVKTRLGWEDDTPLIQFCQGLEEAGASCISVHGRTYKQAFGGQADFSGIYKLKQHVSIPILGNGDIRDYDDAIKKCTPVPTCALEEISKEEIRSWKPLDGGMIGRASFGNPWCFLPGAYRPTLDEILTIMQLHGELLWKTKERKGMMEARKHLVQYLHGFAGAKDFRSRLVHVESPEEINTILSDIRSYMDSNE